MRFVRLLKPTLLDRYLVREMLSPTGLGLLLFTFVLLLQQITLLTGILISRGADFPTILRVFIYLLPSILAVTIPMAFLLGVLLAFGRLATDSEIVALRASGISPATLLRPVTALATAMTLLTFYIMAVALPAANQAHRQILFSLVINKARSSVKPRVFTDDLIPGMVLYVSDIPAETGVWKDVFIHDAREPTRPRVILARAGRLVIDEPHKSVAFHLERGVIHVFQTDKPGDYEQQRFGTAELPLPFEQFFPNLSLAKGDREMTLEELWAKVDEMRAKKRPPVDAARYLVEIHKKFAIPVACIVFGLLGLGLSLGSRKEARSAAFGLSIAVIFIYYVIIRLGEQAGDTGLMQPAIAIWGANVILGTIAIVLLVLNHREAAFDPLDASHYTAWIPRIRLGHKDAPAAAARPLRPRRAAVVVRLPRISVRFPGILDRYIGRAYLGHFTLVLVAFWSLYMLGEFLDLFDDIQQNHVRGKVVLHYYAFHSPFIVHLIAPFAVLVATLTTFGILSRRNEVTAMKAGGVSIYRTVLSVLVLGALASAAMLAMGEFLLPHTNRVADQDFNVIKGRPPQSSSVEHRWIMGSNRFYNYEYLVQSTGEDAGVAEAANRSGFAIYGLSFFDVNPTRWELQERLFVAKAYWNPGVEAYDLESGWRRTFGPKGGHMAIGSIRRSDIEKPAYFRKQEPQYDTLGFADLRSHIARLEAKGFDVIRLRVKLYEKLAFPLIAVVMTLIGVPFAFTVGRRGALYGIGISILIAIVHWACLSIFEALGNNALLPPPLAAWAPILLFAAAGLYLMLTVET